MFNDAMSCIDNIVENCKGRQGISEVAAGLSGGHTDDITSLCGKDEGSVMIEPPAPEPPIEELPDETSINAGSLCPDTYMFDLQQCASDLAQMSGALMDSYNIQEACRMFNDAMSCMENIVDNCEGRPGIAEVAAGVNDNKHNMKDIIGICSTDNSTNTDFVEVENNVTEQDSTECPDGHTSLLIKCVEPLNSVETPSSATNIEEYCRLAVKATDCMQDLMMKCAGRSDIMELSKMMKIDDMAAMTKTTCSGAPQPPSPSIKSSAMTNENCPPDFAQQMMDCVGDDSLDPFEACRIAAKNLKCLGPLLQNCAGESDVQMISSMLNVDEMRMILQRRCANIPPMRPDEVEPEPSNIIKTIPNVVASDDRNCEDVASQLKICKTHITFFENSSGSIHERCRSLNEGFDCYERLVERCRDEPEVVKFTAKVDLNNSREVINSHYCSG